MTTTNGTRAILASLEAERVYIASFANLRATSDEISVQFLKKDHGHPVHIVCAGTEGHISLEDSLLAGALTSQIAEVSALWPGQCSRPSSATTKLSWSSSQWLEVERFLEKRSSVEVAAALGRGGRECAIAIGRERISRTRASSTEFNLVAELQRDSLRIVAV